MEKLVCIYVGKGKTDAKTFEEILRFTKKHIKLPFPCSETFPSAEARRDTEDVRLRGRRVLKILLIPTRSKAEFDLIPGLYYLFSARQIPVFILPLFFFF